jgi:hypothetical protein
MGATIAVTKEANAREGKKDVTSSDMEDYAKQMTLLKDATASKLKKYGALTTMTEGSNLIKDVFKGLIAVATWPVHKGPTSLEDASEVVDLLYTNLHEGAADAYLFSDEEVYRGMYAAFSFASEPINCHAKKKTRKKKKKKASAAANNQEKKGPPPPDPELEKELDLVLRFVKALARDHPCHPSNRKPCSECGSEDFCESARACVTCMSVLFTTYCLLSS